jgi:hypothetical protein
MNTLKSLLFAAMLVLGLQALAQEVESPPLATTTEAETDIVEVEQVSPLREALDRYDGVFALMPIDIEASFHHHKEIWIDLAEGGHLRIGEELNPSIDKFINLNKGLLENQLYTARDTILYHVQRYVELDAPGDETIAQVLERYAGVYNQLPEPAPTMFAQQGAFLSEIVATNHYQLDRLRNSIRAFTENVKNTFWAQLDDIAHTMKNHTRDLGIDVRE